VLLAFEFIAIFSCLLFTGAAVYITLVEHPARMECGTKVAATEFVPSYKRATIMQVGLAVVASVGAVLSWAFGGGMLWLLGAILIVAVIPFTIGFIMPINQVLLDAATDKGSVSTQNLLVAWGRLHGVRTALSLSASVIFLVSALLRQVDQ
jgi:uncharacterized membrane protein